MKEARVDDRQRLYDEAKSDCEALVDSLFGFEVFVLPAEPEIDA